MGYIYDYPRPSVTTDCLVFLFCDGRLKVLLIKRGGEPFKGHYALPGGFLEMDENPEMGAKRELQEETGLQVKELIQVGAFGEIERDPRERTISIVYYTLLKEDRKVNGASDAEEAGWFEVFHVKDLAFDHLKILDKGLEKLYHDLIFAIYKNKPVLGLKREDIENLIEKLNAEKGFSFT